MHQVFICHSTEDSVVAAAVRDRLEEGGISCWMAPRDIETGANWVESIVRAISECSVFLLVFSQHSNYSQHVTRELEQAVDLDLPLVPIRLDSEAPSPTMRYLIGTAQWLDSDPDAIDIESPRLVAAVKRSQTQSGYRSPTRSTPTGRGRRSLVLAAAVLGVVAAFGVGLWLTTSQPGDDPDASSERATTSTSVATTSTSAMLATTTDPSSTTCDPGLFANSVTSCSFARNVRDAFEDSGGATVLEVRSPVTGLTYTMRCTTSIIPVVCRGGNDAEVTIR